jgi:hypothetical protein
MKVGMIFLLAFCCTPGLLKAQSGGCLTGSDSISIIQAVAENVTDTSSAWRTSRANIGISITTRDSISLVTTDSICIAAAQAWASHRSITYDGKKVYLLKLGSNGYVVYKPGNYSGYIPLYVCDPSFAFLDYWSW